MAMPDCSTVHRNEAERWLGSETRAFSWDGVRASVWRLSDTSQRLCFHLAVDWHTVALCLAPPGAAAQMATNASGAVGARAGRIDVVCAGGAVAGELEIEAPAEWFVIEIDPRLPERLSGRGGSLTLVGPFADVDDPVIQQAVLALKRACLSGEPMMDLQVQAQALVILSRLAVHADIASLPRRGGLSPTQLQRVMALADARIEEAITVSELATAAGLSESHFCRAFRQETGLPPRRWLMHRRIERARDLLASTTMPLAEIAFACGLCGQSHLTTLFKQRYGLTPAAYRHSLGTHAHWRPPMQIPVQVGQRDRRASFRETNWPKSIHVIPDGQQSPQREHGWRAALRSGAASRGSIERSGSP